MEKIAYTCKKKCFYRHNDYLDPEGTREKKLYKEGERYSFRVDHVPNDDFVNWFEPYYEGKMIPNDPRAKETVKEK